MTVRWAFFVVEEIGDLNLRVYPYILIAARTSSVSRLSQENYILTALPYKYLPWTLLGKPEQTVNDEIVAPS